MRRLAARAVALIVVAALAAATGCSGGGGSTKAFCASAQNGDNPLDVFDRYDPTNVSTARDQLQRGVDRLRQLENAAPSSIRSDLGVLVDVGQKLVAALDPAGGSTAAPDFRADSARVQDASAAVTQFARDQCGIDLTTPSSAPAPASGPPTSSGGN
jgi:hypothetical protein